jgi:hypothetical protein
MLITTAAEFRALNAETPTVSIGFNPKREGLLHDGHRHLIQYAKQFGQVCCNRFDPTPFKILFGQTDAVQPDEDLQYEIDTLTSFGADHIWVPGPEIVNELRPAAGWNSALQTINNVVQNQGYDILPTGYLRQLKFYMLTSYLIRHGYPGSWLKVESNKEGLYSYIKKHFWDNYIGTGFTMIEPLLRPDGLVYGSNLLTRPESEITRLINIVNRIRERAEDLEDPTVREQLKTFINNLKEADERWDFLHVKVFRGGFLPQGVVYIQLAIEAEYGARLVYMFKL